MRCRVAEVATERGRGGVSSLRLGTGRSSRVFGRQKRSVAGRPSAAVRERGDVQTTRIPSASDRAGDRRVTSVRGVDPPRGSGVVDREARDHVPPAGQKNARVRVGNFQKPTLASLRRRRTWVAQSTASCWRSCDSREQR